MFGIRHVQDWRERLRARLALRLGSSEARQLAITPEERKRREEMRYKALGEIYDGERGICRERPPSVLKASTDNTSKLAPEWYRSRGRRNSADSAQSNWSNWSNATTLCDSSFRSLHDDTSDAWSLTTDGRHSIDVSGRNVEEWLEKCWN
jgi:hypothetical protein